MFLDLAIMVEQQGEFIDRVEENVSNTLAYTESAALEMQGALVKKRKLQRKKWILLILGIILAIAIGIAIWQTVANS